jgi:hypothetical protein
LVGDYIVLSYIVPTIGPGAARLWSCSPEHGVAAAAGFGIDQRLDLRNPRVLARLLRVITQEHGPASNLYPDQLLENAANEAVASIGQKAS